MGRKLRLSSHTSRTTTNSRKAALVADFAASHPFTPASELQNPNIRHRHDDSVFLAPAGSFVRLNQLTGEFQ